jgi:two-component system response regulator FixJ
MPDSRLVHLVDDEESVRRSVAFLLKTSGYAVQAWASGSDFVKDMRHVDKGCVLLDVRMPDMDGLEVQAAMAARGIKMPVIVLTGHGDVSVAVKAMKAGAVDFVEKPFDRAQLLDAIGVAFDQLDNAERRRDHAAGAMTQIAALTPREQDVLKGLAQGFPNKTIAYDLGISPRTVEVHRANLMMKLGVASFPDALRIAFAAGLGEEA